MRKPRQTYRKPEQMPEPPCPSYILRAEDIRAMVDDGSIANQHFLIRLLASNMQLSNTRQSDISRKTV